ncbi:MAG: HAMP domain-containing histidine kinase [Chloroflexi bacterium]|nr:HAMP domain-containing histidine kinase [Chloroflexota bacterium]
MTSLILLFGDTPSDTLQTQLSQAGYSLRRARGKTLAAVRAAKPVAVLVEVSNPTLNGIHLIGQLKAHDATLPVIALHRGEHYLQQAALVAGADAVLPAPPDPAHLLKRLRGVSETFGSIVANGSQDMLGTAAILSHDLKSPISIIISTLEVLIAMHTGDDDGTLRLLRGALSAAYRQLNLLGDMLDLMRLEIGAYELECHPCNLVELVQDYMVADAPKLTANKTLLVEMNLSPTPLIACLDANLTWRILNTLMDNINKFTVENDLVRVTAQTSGNSIVLTFADSGRPITAGFERQIVEQPPLWQDREAGTRTSVAMGLPFIFAAAKAQNGQFRAYTDPVTHLTTFTLTFPVYQAGD